MINKLFFLLILASSFIYCQVYDDSNNRFLLGQSYLQAGNYEKAKEIFADLYNVNPGNPQFFQMYNETLLALKEYTASINLIEQKLKTNQLDINLWGMLGSAYYLQGNEEKAFSVWDEALLKAGQTAASYRVIANYAIERRAFDKAIDIMEKGKAVSNEPEMFSYELANLYSLTMAYRKAAGIYCELLQKKPDQVSAVEGRLFSYVNKPDALAQTIEVFEECKDDNNPSVDYLLAQLYLQQKSYDKAYEYYKLLDTKQGNQGASLYNFALSVYNDGEYETASKVLGDLIEKYPGSPFIPSAKLAYAKTLEAVVIKEEDTKIPSWKPYYSIERISSPAVEKVVSAYKEIEEQYKGQEAANEALLRAGLLKLQYENNPAEAKEYFNRLINNSPLSGFTADAYEQLAVISLSNGNLDEAGQYLEKIGTSGRADEEMKNSARLKLANVYFYKGDFSKAKETLNTILDNLKDNSANDAIELSLLLNTTMNDSSNLLNFAQAEFLAEQKKFEEAEAKYNQIAGNPRAFMLGSLAKVRGAEMELALNKYETSVELLSKISEDGGDNIYADKALYLLGEIYRYGLKDKTRAEQAYESLLAKFPNSLYLDEAREAILNLRNKPS